MHRTRSREAETPVDKPEMADHREQCLLPFTPEQIFDLVGDVERYPEFLPLWHQAAVIRRSRDHSEEHYHTEQTLQLGPLHKRFCTQTRLRRPSQIVVTSDDPLFDRFVIQWRFEPREPGSCLVDFSLRCDASSLLLRPLFDTVLTQSSPDIVRAFARRARLVYRG